MIDPILRKYQSQPTEFFKDFWPDIYLWDKLTEISDSVAGNRRTVVPSGHGIGKTFIAARIVLWFLFCHYPAKVITTAPTWPQVKRLLWAEIHKAYNIARYPLGGTLLQTELNIDEDWFAMGVSTDADVAERQFGATRLQGIHSPNLLAVLDEAPGVEQAIWTAIDTLITGQNNKILAIGNPTSPSGSFYNACKSPLWHKVHVSSFDHPNVKENRLIVPGAVTAEWIEDYRAEYGEGTPLWQAKVLGQFPAEGTDTLIPLTWAEACVGLKLNQENEVLVKRLGIDVARYGDDKTALCEILGAEVQPIETIQKKDTNWTIGQAIRKNRQQQYEAIGVDDTGVGGGVTDGLEDAGLEVDPINFGSAAIEADTFENRAAELWWNLRKALETKELSLPNDPELINQLCSRKYRQTRKGKIALETKDEMKKRGLKSPDKADALAIAYGAGLASEAPTITIISTAD